MESQSEDTGQGYSMDTSTGEDASQSRSGNICIGDTYASWILDRSIFGGKDDDFASHLLEIHDEYCRSCYSYTSKQSKLLHIKTEAVSLGQSPDSFSVAEQFAVDADMSPQESSDHESPTKLNGTFTGVRRKKRSTVPTVPIPVIKQEGVTPIRQSRRLSLKPLKKYSLKMEDNFKEVSEKSKTATRGKVTPEGKYKKEKSNCPDENVVVKQGKVKLSNEKGKTSHNTVENLVEEATRGKATPEEKHITGRSKYPAEKVGSKHENVKLSNDKGKTSHKNNKNIVEDNESDLKIGRKSSSKHEKENSLEQTDTVAHEKEKSARKNNKCKTPSAKKNLTHEIKGSSHESKDGEKCVETATVNEASEDDKVSKEESETAHTEDKGLFKEDTNSEVSARKDSDNKQFKCAECGKMFSRLAHLNRHMNIHTGARMFACDTCGWLFKDNSNFLKHIRACAEEPLYMYSETSKKVKEADGNIEQKNRSKDDNSEVRKEHESTDLDTSSRSVMESDDPEKNNDVKIVEMKETLDKTIQKTDEEDTENENVDMGEEDSTSESDAVNQKISSDANKDDETVDMDVEISENDKTSTGGIQDDKGPVKIESIHKCQHCNKMFSTKDFLLKHEHIQHLSREYKCGVCKSVHESKLHLKRHQKTHEDGQYKCEPCGRNFTREKAYDRHHCSASRQLMCSTCGKIFRFHHQLTSHMYSHTGERPHKCEQCDKEFLHKSNLLKHMYLHTGQRPHTCDVCGKSFTLRGHLKRHMQLHSGEKPHKCDICGRCFADISNLSAHQATHTGIKSFKCEYCGMSFHRKNTMMQHQRIHTNTKPYVCDVCQRAFTFSTNLSKHKRIHTGVRPYQCEHCNRKFSDSSHLSRHRRRHLGLRPYKCGECGKTFTMSHHVRAHMRTHNVDPALARSVLEAIEKTKDPTYINVDNVEFLVNDRTEMENVEYVVRNEKDLDNIKYVVKDESVLQHVKYMVRNATDTERIKYVVKDSAADNNVQYVEMDDPNSENIKYVEIEKRDADDIKYVEIENRDTPDGQYLVNKVGSGTNVEYVVSDSASAKNVRYKDKDEGMEQQKIDNTEYVKIEETGMENIEYVVSEEVHTENVKYQYVTEDKQAGIEYDTENVEYIVSHDNVASDEEVKYIVVLKQ